MPQLNTEINTEQKSYGMALAEPCNLNPIKATVSCNYLQMKSYICTGDGALTACCEYAIRYPFDYSGNCYCP